MDSRDFGIGAQILHDLSIRKLRVITNSKQKPRVGITGMDSRLSTTSNFKKP